MDLLHVQSVPHPEEDVCQTELLLQGDVVGLVPHLGQGGGGVGRPALPAGPSPAPPGPHQPRPPRRSGTPAGDNSQHSLATSRHLIRHVCRHVDRLLDLREELDPELVGPPPIGRVPRPDHVCQPAGGWMGGVSLARGPSGLGGQVA